MATAIQQSDPSLSDEPLYSMDLSDGTKLSWMEWGTSDGVPVLYSHGTPGSALEGAFLHDKAIRCNIRLIAPNRMGIASTSPGSSKEDWSLARYPRQVRELLDFLKIDSIGLLGWSSGVPHSLYCAHQLSSRVTAIVLAAGYSNFGQMPEAEDVLWAADQRGAKIAHRSELLFHIMSKLLEVTKQLAPALYMQLIERSCSVRDRQLLYNREIREIFLANQDVALGNGCGPVEQDLLMQYRPWGVRLEEIFSPVFVYQGTEDRFVPPAFAHHLEQHLPNVKAQYLARQGHLFPLERRFQDLLFRHYQTT